MTMYRNVIDGIYGVYLDAVTGFDLGLRQLDRLQRDSLRDMPDMTLECRASRPFVIHRHCGPALPARSIA